ncbi:replication initiation protein [Tortoise microvirus 39]|nr:replication initiation protein [Tortoise microvirus 39]
MHVFLDPICIFRHGNGVTKKMCQSPNKLACGTLVACRECWQCNENRITDWVGRCIAETETAVRSHAFTLTYGRDEGGNVHHARSAVLTYSDVQKFFKLLRRHGYPCRFLVAGEYGERKGRAHWHGVIFWQDRAPDLPLRENYQHPYWPHGHTYWDDPLPSAMRYACKYITKDNRKKKQSYISMSKRPLLGAQYFTDLAGTYVRQQLAPQGPYYWFPQVLARTDGKPVKFYMSEAVRDHFCQSYLDQWQARYPDRHPPVSQLLEEYEDRKARFDRDFKPDRFRPGGSYPWMPTPNGEAIRFSQPHNAYYYDGPEGRRFWSFDQTGDRAWLSVVRTDPLLYRSINSHDLALYAAGSPTAAMGFRNIE